MQTIRSSHTLCDLVAASYALGQAITQDSSTAAEVAR